MSTASKVTIAALSGVAAGILTGILIAPKSGKETRKDISKKATKIKTKLVNKKDDLLLNFMILKERFSEIGHDLTDDVKEKISSEIKDMESKLQSGAKKAKAAVNGALSN